MDRFGVMGAKVDAIIFGATGFTGKIAVENAIEVLKDFRWGIAGRNRTKLESLLKEVGTKVGKDLSAIPIIIADANDEASIQAMAKRCKIILNCCGPYRFYGEAVVKACVEAGTHHVDISGESEYFNKMHLKYHDLAQQNGSYVVSTCAFDSLPAEMGVAYSEKNFPGTVNSIESFWENSVNVKQKASKGRINYGTWESLVHALSHVREMIELQKKVTPRNLPPLSPKLGVRYLPHRVDFLNRYFIPFPGIDRGVVRRSQYYLWEHEGKRPVQFEIYLGFKPWLVASCFPFLLAFFCLLTQIGFTRNLLLKYPEFFTFGQVTRGPPEENTGASKYRMTFRTKGWARGTPLSEEPDKEILTRVSGNSAYEITSVGLICTAQMILQESHNIPGRGGVLTPAAAFGRTSLIEKLSQHKNGIKFEVLN